MVQLPPTPEELRKKGGLTEAQKQANKKKAEEQTTPYAAGSPREIDLDGLKEGIWHWLDILFTLLFDSDNYEMKLRVHGYSSPDDPKKIDMSKVPEQLREDFKKGEELRNDPNAKTMSRREILEKIYGENFHTQFGRQIIELAATQESHGNYNIMNGGAIKPLTSMTIDQVLEMQKNPPSGSSAAGKYQIMRETLMDIKKIEGLTGKELFNETMQERLGLALLERRELSKFINEEINVEQFMKNIAMEWAAMPVDMSGQSYHKNHPDSKIDPNQVLNLLDPTRS